MFFDLITSWTFSRMKRRQTWVNSFVMVSILQTVKYTSAAFSGVKQEYSSSKQSFLNDELIYFRIQDSITFIEIK